MIMSSSFSENHPTTDGIIEFLQSLLLKAATVHHIGHPQNHPIVVINSLKNILGDVRKNPSRILMKFGKDYFMGKSLRKNDENRLNKIKSKGVTTSVFIMDLEDLILQRKLKQAEEEAAKLFILADSPQAILESLVNISLHDFTRYGIFSYHLLRAFAFRHFTKEESWKFIICFLKQIRSVNFAPYQQDTTINIEKYFVNTLKSKSKIISNQFNSAYRLYHSNYVRTGSFKKSVCNWIASKQWNPTSQKLKDLHPEKLVSFRNSGGNYFVNIAESIINKTENIFTKGKKLVFLDSLRMICKDAPENTLGLIEQRLKNI